MFRWLENIIAWFRPRPKQITLKDIGLDKGVKIKEKPGEDVEEAGRWYFKRDILDRLDDYMKYMSIMKNTDPVGYAMFSTVGASISGPKTMFNVGELPPSWRQDKGNSFGAVAFVGDTLEEGKVPLRVGYYLKYDIAPPYVQAHSGDIYEVTIFHADSKKWKASGKFFVAVEADAKIVLLKENTKIYQTIQPKKKKGRKQQKFQIAKSSWSHGKMLKAIAEENNYEIQSLARFLFCLFVNDYQNASTDIRIRAERDNIVATFSVDLLRTPYFFKDRDPVIEGNKYKRIFHIVRTHKRTYKDGREVNIKSHFRGLRKFTWHGYRINITMPGYHHSDVLDTRFGLHFLEKIPGRKKKFLSIKKTSKFIDEHTNV